MAIVGDLKQLQTTLLDKHFDGRGARVDGILKQLFQSVHGSNNDLASSDLVDDIFC